MHEISANMCAADHDHINSSSSYAVNATLFILYYFPTSQHVSTSLSHHQVLHFIYTHYQAAAHLHVFSTIFFGKIDKIKFGKINYVLKL
jgi:hypothetical protein